MGFALCTGACIGCGRLFMFNPVRVPSTSAVTGSREPLCRTCFDSINAHRVSQGLAAFHLADDAYDAYEACDESELYT